MNKSIIASVVAGLCALGTAHAQIQLVQNGTFANGLTDWTTTGDVTISNNFNGGSIIDLSTPIIHADSGPATTATVGNGNFAVLNGTESGQSFTSATIDQSDANTLSSGTFSFDYDIFAHNTTSAPHQVTGPSSGDSTLSVSIGPDVLATVDLDTTFFDATGNGGSDTGWMTLDQDLSSLPTGALTFNFNISAQDEAGGYYFGAAIDDVSLVENATDPVPDSSSTALLLGGVLSTLCFLRRKLA